MGFSIPQLASCCRLTMSADQLNPTPTVAVAFDTEDFAVGDLSRSGSTITGFKAGKVYLVACDIRISYPASCLANFQLIDVSAATLIQEWRAVSPSAAIYTGESQMICLPFAPSIDTSVRVDMTVANPAGTDIDAISGGHTYLIAVELGFGR